MLKLFQVGHDRHFSMFLGGMAWKVMFPGHKCSLTTNVVVCYLQAVRPPNQTSRSCGKFETDHPKKEDVHDGHLYVRSAESSPV